MPNHYTHRNANRDPIINAPVARTGDTADAKGAGAAVGAVLGGLDGKAVARNFDTARVDEHWRDRFDSEPYYAEGMDYEDYAPAYQLGAQYRIEAQASSFDEIEDEIASQYDEVRGDSRLEWEDARHAARASWHTTYD